MALREHQQRVQACLLDGGAEEQRQIEAGREAGFGNLRRAANLLPAVLEAGRRQRIVQPHRGDGAPDAGGQFPGVLGATFVAVQRRVLTVLAQDVCGLLQQALDGRLVGLNKGSDQVGKMV